ncbi:MAG: DUF4389 domain-containing protein [Planktomarina sp.]
MDDGFELNEPRKGPAQENLWLRLFYMILIWFMIQFAWSVLGFLTVIQFIIMLFNKRQPNEQLAEFGTTLGIWVAKATRYQTAASEVRPWPWSELD